MRRNWRIQDLNKKNIISSILDPFISFVFFMLLQKEPKVETEFIFIQDLYSFKNGFKMSIGRKMN